MRDPEENISTESLDSEKSDSAEPRDSEENISTESPGQMKEDVRVSSLTVRQEPRHASFFGIDIVDWVTPLNIQFLLLVFSCGVNVWLVGQNVRWFGYHYTPVRNLMPFTDRITEWIVVAAAVLIALLFSLVLFHFIIKHVWRHIKTVHAKDFILFDTLVNGILLIILTAIGIIQWWLLVGIIPLDLKIVAPLGAVACLVIFFINRSQRWNTYD